MLRHPTQPDLEPGLAGKLASYLASLRVVTTKAPLRIQHTPPREAREKEHHCFLLHGWAGEGAFMHATRDALRRLDTAASWHFWDVTYDTQWTTFPDTAQRIITELESSPHDFEDTILIGYSMGGIVARQMVALGFSCHALLTICSPHHGPAPWVPRPTRGPQSLAPHGPALTALNADPVDTAARPRYFFFGTTFSDMTGRHDHDGIVPLYSALGKGLGPVALRHTTHMTYKTLGGHDPHWRGMFPAHLPAPLQTARRLFGEQAGGSTLTGQPVGPAP